jgi:hypothetical protein
MDVLETDTSLNCRVDYDVHEKQAWVQGKENTALWENQWDKERTRPK